MKPTLFPRVDRAAAIAVALAFGCTNHQDRNMLAAEDLSTGTSSVVIEDLGVALEVNGLDGPQLSSQDAPVAGDSVMFDFVYSDEYVASDLGCDHVAWTTLQPASGPLPLASLCDGAPARLEIRADNVNSPLTGDLTIPLTTGTLTVLTTLEPDGTGVIAIQLDIPTTELAGTDSANVAHKVRVAAAALVGHTIYTTQAVDSGGGCSSGEPLLGTL